MKNFHFFALFFQTFLKIMITASLTCYFGSLLKAHLDIEVKGLDCLSRSFCVFSPYSRKEFLKVFKEESLHIILMIRFY